MKEYHFTVTDDEISEVLGENDWRKCPYCGSEKHFVNHCPNMWKEESK